MTATRVVHQPGRIGSVNLKRRLLAVLALAIAAVVIYKLAAPSYRQGEPSIAGTRAPDFPFELNGNAARLTDLRGKVVVLNFWATWCPPCVEETPSLNRLQQQIAAHGGMVLGISVDDDPAAYDRFLRQQQVRFPTWRDPSRRISLRYGTSMYPESYILTREGYIAKKVVGPQRWDDPSMLAYLNQLLAAKN